MEVFLPNYYIIPHFPLTFYLYSSMIKKINIKFMHIIEAALHAIFDSGSKGEINMTNEYCMRSERGARWMLAASARCIHPPILGECMLNIKSMVCMQIIQISAPCVGALICGFIGFSRVRRFGGGGYGGYLYRSSGYRCLSLPKAPPRCLPLHRGCRRSA